MAGSKLKLKKLFGVGVSNGSCLGGNIQILSSISKHDSLLQTAYWLDEMILWDILIWWTYLHAETLINRGNISIWQDILRI